MTNASEGVRIRLTVCSTCGHHGRLLIATPRETISRCHFCGDELRTEKAPSVQMPVQGVVAPARVHAGL